MRGTPYLTCDDAPEGFPGACVGYIEVPPTASTLPPGPLDAAGTEPLLEARDLAVRNGWKPRPKPRLIDMDEVARRHMLAQQHGEQP
jgi:hypothetical protein